MTEVAMILLVLLGWLGHAQWGPEKRGPVVIVHDMCEVDEMVMFPNSEDLETTPAGVARAIVEHNCRWLSVCAPQLMPEGCGE